MNTALVDVGQMPPEKRRRLLRFFHERGYEPGTPTSMDLAIASVAGFDQNAVYVSVCIPKTWSPAEADDLVHSAMEYANVKET